MSLVEHKQHISDDVSDRPSLELDDIPGGDTPLLHGSPPPPYQARRDDDGDLEAQPLVENKLHSKPEAPAPEYNVETRKKLFYLTGYFALNLLLTIYNKAVLGGFNFPWLLTAIHCSCVFFGCYSLMLRGWFKLTELDTTPNLVLVAFSFLFTINIAISNVSL